MDKFADLEKAVVETSLRWTELTAAEPGIYHDAEREEWTNACEALRTARESVAQPKVCEPLLPCPFCGAHATRTNSTSGFGIACWSCPASTGCHSTREKSEAAWNTRAPALPPAEPARGVGLGDTLAPLSDRLNYAATGSCSCLGKRVGIAAHSPLCHYRLFLEAMAFVEDNSVPPAAPTVAKKPTDEAIEHFLWGWPTEKYASVRESRIAQVRGALAHFSPPGREISDDASRFDFAAFVSRKMAHSIKAFGPNQTIHGVCDHIRKELAEVEANPTDRTEWIDVLLLAIDGAGRSGMDADEMIAGLEAKLQKNEARQWPDWRDADASQAIEHIRAEELTPKPAPSNGYSAKTGPKEIIPPAILYALYDLAHTTAREAFAHDARMMLEARR